jgi:tetratricopeptide (TPR) repeat protein
MPLLMKRLVFTALFMLSLAHALAQQNRGVGTPPPNATIDSLLKELSTSTADTTKISIYIVLSQTYGMDAQVEKLSYAKQALDEAKKIDWKKGIGLSYRALGTYYLNLNDYPSALQNYSTALNIFQALNDETNVVYLLTNIGFIYYRESKYPLAIQYCLSALKMCEKINNTDYTARNERYLGNIYLRQADYGKAEEYYSKALKTYQGNNDSFEMARAYNSLGESQRYQKKYELALEYYTKALRIFEQKKNKAQIATSLLNMGELYKMQGQFDLALTYTLQALQIANDIGEKSMIANCTGNIGEHYLGMAKISAAKKSAEKGLYIDKAISYLNEGIEKEQELNTQDAIIEFGAYLAEAYQLKGDYKNALELTLKYQKLKDSIFSAQNIASINAAEKKYQLDLKDVDIKLANAELTKRNYAIVFIGVGMLLLIVVVVITQRNSRIKERLNATITKLVNEQEKVIETRTAELAISNKKLIELIQYSAHNLREPLTRIIGAMNIREDIDEEEFYNEVWPQMRKATNDLDNVIKDVIQRADEVV